MGRRAARRPRTSRGNVGGGSVLLWSGSSWSWCIAISDRKRDERPDWPPRIRRARSATRPSLCGWRRGTTATPRFIATTERRSSARAPTRRCRAPCSRATSRSCATSGATSSSPRRRSSSCGGRAGQIARASDGCAFYSRPATSIDSAPSRVAGRSRGPISKRPTGIAWSSVPVISRAASGSTRAASTTTATSSTRSS